MEKTKKQKRKGRRNGGSTTMPVVVYKDLPDMAIDTPTATAIKVNDLLGGSDWPSYSFNLQHLCIEVIAPMQVVNGTSWVAVDTCLMQVYGYMKQDDTLARQPMSTWRSVGKSRALRFNFNRRYIVSNIFVGGHVPIVNVNSDAMFGVHALWSSSSVTPADVKMKLTIKVKATFKMSFDLSITHITTTGNRIRYGLDESEDPENTISTKARIYFKQNTT